ncbi:MAG TPA: ABC transporter permease subunit [Candidatus Limnocylindria bacterium]|nr:ABC transporter permease subunit [Candidatus Limnocylindria bacterium]
MLRTITTKTLRDGRRALLWWALGLSGLTILTVATYPAVRDMPGMEELLEGLPDAILALIGESDLLSPEGYLNSQLFGAIVPLLFLFFGVAAGAGAIAGEEENRTLDLLLANPVSRTRVALEKALAMVIGLVLLGAILWIATYLPGLAVDMDLDPMNLVAVVVSACLFGFFMGGFALMVGGSSGSRGLAIGLGAALGVAAYLVNSLAPLVEGLDWLQRLSPFYYYYEADPLRNGLDPVHAAVLGVGGLLFVLVAVIGFRRRDVGV